MRGMWLVAVVMTLSASTAQGQAAIYRCTTDAGTTFSDRPCGPAAAPVTLDDSRFSTFASVPVDESLATALGKPKPSKPAARTTRLARTKVVGPDSERCVRIRTSLREIDARLRAGYRAKKGIWLEERKRNLRQQARELKC